MGLEDPSHIDECSRVLKKSILFRHANQAQIDRVSRQTSRREFKQGDVLITQGEPTDVVFVLVTGQAEILRDAGGAPHPRAPGSVGRQPAIQISKDHVEHVDFKKGGQTVGLLHCIRGVPSYSTVVVTSPDMVSYIISSEKLVTCLKQDPDLAVNVVYGLTKAIRKQDKIIRHSLLEQRPHKSPIYAITIASGVESFYRSALNSLINAKLTGVRGAFFPDMHIQLPTRMLYINGLKGVRMWLDKNVDTSTSSNPGMMRLGLAVTPGLVMTPVSSVLEACNAGHSNKEPIYKRWIRGISARSVREIIFGVGLNQLSDYCEERVPDIKNQIIKNAVGSMAAGLTAGYFSHVPHNLSTLKLMNPTLSYGHHFHALSREWYGRLPNTMASRPRNVTSYALSLIAPKGLAVRTAQIAGSFMILNGCIGAIQRLSSKL
eukprot:TRINITY_DN6897_c0_g1_i1.p1 TRINITY_DN6897_c0_g1~~TRINITY_DN6897_c0_g1_i1.p1  ORF type:complete len:455 (+),score=48.29 TRINITY_DN6897_c0_g1_i1:70-1365(+)